jgi:hypothetical protein
MCQSRQFWRSSSESLRTKTVCDVIDCIVDSSKCFQHVSGVSDSGYGWRRYCQRSCDSDLGA